MSSLYSTLAIAVLGSWAICADASALRCLNSTDCDSIKCSCCYGICDKECALKGHPSPKCKCQCVLPCCMRIMGGPEGDQQPCSSAHDDCFGPRKGCCPCRKPCRRPPSRSYGGGPQKPERKQNDAKRNSSPSVRMAGQESSCKAPGDCRSDQDCEQGSCVKKNPQKSESDTFATRAGFVSTAVVTTAIFVLFFCCCFFKIYAGKTARGQDENCQQRTTTTSLPLGRGANLDRPRIQPVDPGSQPSCHGPPPYCTLSFTDLPTIPPPSYDEAVGNSGTAVRHFTSV